MSCPLLMRVVDGRYPPACVVLFLGVYNCIDVGVRLVYAELAGRGGWTLPLWPDRNFTHHMRRMCALHSLLSVWHHDPGHHGSFHALRIYTLEHKHRHTHIVQEHGTGSCGGVS